MKLKRGWWKQLDGGYAYVVVFRDGRWYGINNYLDATSWDASGRWDDVNQGSTSYDLVTYCGDGPEPVEPVQLCVGWWECRNKTTTEIVTPTIHKPPRWIDQDGTQYTSDGVAINFPGDLRNIVKRRPDLDAKEAEQAQPDPRDAEIAKLTMDNRSLTVRVDNQRLVIDRLTSRLSTIQTEYNNLARIIGDH